MIFLHSGILQCKQRWVWVRAESHIWQNCWSRSKHDQKKVQVTAKLLVLYRCLNGFHQGNRDIGGGGGFTAYELCTLAFLRMIFLMERKNKPYKNQKSSCSYLVISKIIICYPFQPHMYSQSAIKQFVKSDSEMSSIKRGLLPVSLIFMKTG
jgi:hypothetical protein